MQVYQLVIGVPFFLFLLYLIKIPESVRWLLTRGRRADARKLIHDIAAFNNVILPDLNVEQEDEEEEGEGEGMKSSHWRGSGTGCSRR